MSFESVKQNGPVWQPTHTGSKKNNDLVHLAADDKSFVEGYYLGATHNQGPENNSTIHKVKVTKVGAKAQIVGEKVDESNEVSLWGTTVLNDNLGKISVGEMVRVVWLGKKAPKKGTNHYHDWDVLVDRTAEKYKGTVPAATVTDKTAEVSEPVTNVATGEEDDDLPFN